MADYFDAVEAEIDQEQQRYPDVVLPWSWWQKQGEKHGMTPHAIYTRAVKIGLYVPPSKRDGAKVSGTSKAVSRTAAPPPPTEEKQEMKAAPPVDPPSGRYESSATQPGLGDAIQGFSSIVERVAGLEQQAADLSRDLTAVRMENRRLRRILREMDGFAEKIRQTYMTVINED